MSLVASLPWEPFIMGVGVGILLSALADLALRWED